MTDEKLALLESLAKAAQGGPWTCAMGQSYLDFTLAVSPEVVLALVAEVRKWREKERRWEHERP